MNECIQRIRTFINHPRRYQTIYKNRDLWNQLCSSLNVIDDTEFAIDAYSSGGFGADTGVYYLVVYGLLQALFLQQDAVFHMCESLEIEEKLDDYPKLKEIRKIRNISIGYPTKKDRPKPTSYHFLARVTLDSEDFQILSHYGDGRQDVKYVSIPHLIADQRRYISGILISAINELEQRDITHKEKFKMEKLTAVFPETLSYHIGNVFLSINNIESIGLGSVDLALIKKAIKNFQQALLNRGVQLEIYSLKNIYDDVEYALSKVETFFQCIIKSEESGINAKDAFIYTFFIEKMVAELKKTAQEIDEEYSA